MFLRTSLSIRRFRAMQIAFVAFMLMLLVISPAAASAGDTSSSDERFLLPARDPEIAVKVIKPFARLKAARGVELSFYALRDEKGRVQAVNIAQSSDSGWTGLSDIRALRDANPMVIFHALSRPGTQIPPIFKRLYGQPEGAQGWARGQLVYHGGTVEYSCLPGSEPFNSFDNDILAKGYAGVFLSEKDGPFTKPSHWGVDPGPADGTDWYRLRGGVTGAKAFYTKVQYCFADYNIYGPFEPDPSVTVYSRLSGFGSYLQASKMSLTDPGDELEYFSFPQTGASYDYRLEINLARIGDMFHIGATWSKPGYLAPNN